MFGSDALLLLHCKLGHHGLCTKASCNTQDTLPKLLQALSPFPIIRQA